MKSRYALLLLPLALASCEVTDDPRSGGLAGYLATGDAGYQRRIMQRQGYLDHVENDNASQERQRQQLQGRKASVTAQLNRLSQLRQQAQSLVGGVSLVGKIRQTERDADSIPNLENRVQELEAQVEALKRRQ